MTRPHLLNWLSSRFARRTRRRRTPRPRWHFARPRLETLEDRTLLATFVVDPNPTVGNFTSIQAAVSSPMVASGDTINVNPGTYTEQVTINKSLTLQQTPGTPPGSAIIQSPTTMTSDSFGLNTLVEVNNAATVNINNMTIEGPNPSIDEGILVVGGATANVTGSTIADITRGNGVQTGIGILVGGATVAAAGQVGHATITDCTVTDYQKAGIVIGRNGSSGTITGSTITGAGPTTVIAQNGIQISTGAGSSTVTGNTISGNEFSPQTALAAGILDDATNSTVITGNTIENNDAGIFKGVLATSSLPLGTTTISGNNIMSNTWGIIIQNGTADVSFNRIVGNSVGLLNQTMTTVDAINNWWGSNAGPGGAGSDTVSGPVDFNPWLVLEVTASPTTLLPGGVATVVADLTKNNSGVDTSALGHVPDGIPVTFSDALGTISPTTSTLVSGMATATFTADNTPGVATVSATVDNQTSSATITILPGATTIQLTTVHIVPNLLGGTAQVTMTAQVSNPVGTVNEGVVTFTLAGVSVQGTVQNGTANAQVVIPLMDLASNLAVQLTIPSTYADNRLPPLFGPGSAVTPVVVNVWNALLPSTVTLTAGGGEQNAISFPFVPMVFSYVNQVWTAFHFGPMALQVQYTAFGNLMVLTLNGLPQQVMFFATPSQFLGAATLALSDVVPLLMANTSGPQLLSAILRGLSGGGGPALLLSNALWQLVGTVPL